VKKKQSYDYELIAMCYHEASHIICGLVNYMEISDAGVMRNEEGYTNYVFYGPEDIKDKILEKILITNELQTCYAGLVGEKLYYKNICGSDKFPLHLRIGSHSDLKEASKIINKHKLSESGKKRLVFKKQIQEDIKVMLLEHWDAVKILAHALYKKKKLTFEEIKLLLIKKSENKDFWRGRFKKISIIQNKMDDENAEEIVKSILLEDSIYIY
jgi:hypothetical protein